MIDEEILQQVQRPGRYIGSEINMIKKDHQRVRVKVALAFPDTYEVGMSHLGIKLLYGILNSRPDVACERVFAPWIDMEKIMRERGIFLWSLETGTKLKDFDIVGFSLQTELGYTNVLNMLELGGVPFRSRDRAWKDPLVIGGGPCCANPEPMAEFFDLFLVGEAEEAILEIVDVYLKASGKNELLREMARIDGVYVPSLYKVAYTGDGTIKAIEPELPGLPAKIKKRTVSDLDKAFYPVKPVVPFIQAVHDRINLEIMRGCSHRCRFCQARVIYHPLRKRSASRLVELAKQTVANTGYEEITLLSLSSGDYPQIRELVERLNDLFSGKGVAVSLPSLRIEKGLSRLPHAIARVKKTGLTFAPETGSDRLRQLINKQIDIEELTGCIVSAYEAGWRKVKLYFMIGLPTETKEDLNGIVKLVGRLKGFKGKVIASIASFVPRPHTPLEQTSMMDLDSLKERISYLKERFGRMRGVKADFHLPELSYLEAVLGRGDRRQSSAILGAWRKGAKFDGWSETFRFDRWMEAFDEVGLAPEFYATRRRLLNEIPPWNHIDVSA